MKILKIKKRDLKWSEKGRKRSGKRARELEGGTFDPGLTLKSFLRPSKVDILLVVLNKGLLHRKSQVTEVRTP